MSKLLIVDDEPSICWGLSRLAERMGHEPQAASAAEQALELAARQAPDAVVLDVRLPGMDGLTALERLRPLCGAAPIIVTVPSAGETTSPSTTGVTRGGSRKK